MAVCWVFVITVSKPSNIIVSVTLGYEVLFAFSFPPAHQQFWCTNSFVKMTTYSILKTKEHKLHLTDTMTVEV